MYLIEKYGLSLLGVGEGDVSWERAETSRFLTRDQQPSALATWLVGLPLSVVVAAGGPFYLSLTFNFRCATVSHLTS